MSRSPVVQDELGLRIYGILGSRNGVIWGGAIIQSLVFRVK